MPWATLWSPALGHRQAVTSSTDSCLELSCGRATLGQYCYVICRVLSMERKQKILMKNRNFFPSNIT